MASVTVPDKDEVYLRDIRKGDIVMRNRAYFLVCSAPYEGYAKLVSLSGGQVYDGYSLRDVKLVTTELRLRNVDVKG